MKANHKQEKNELHRILLYFITFVRTAVKSNSVDIAGSLE